MQYEDALRKTKSLNVSKVSQQTGGPIKVLIENCKYFAYYFLENINYYLDKSLLFPLDLKLAHVAPAYKKKSNNLKIIIGQ